MASAGSVYVDLMLRDANYRQGWNRARVYTQQGSRQVQGDVGKMRQSFEGVLNPINNLGTALRNLGVIVAGSLSVQKLVQYSDTWKSLEGRLKVVQGDFENIGDTQERLFEIAQRTRQPLENILGFYSRLKQFIPEAERAQYDLFNTTEGVATALALTGEISESATAAMIQLTQAIGTNFESAGQELRSLQEQAPRLTTAIQRAFGDGTQTLQQLVKTGELTRETFIAIFQDGSKEFQKLQAELDKMPLTVAQSFQRLDNAMLKFIGQSEEAQSVTGALALGVSNLSENLELVANILVTVAAVAFAKYVSSIAATQAPTIAAAAGQLKYSVAVSQTSKALGANSAASLRWAAAVTKANAAAAGSTSQLAGATVLVNRFGEAAVAQSTVFARLATSVRGFGSALFSALGGPVGIAIIGTITLMQRETEYAAETQARLNEEVGNFQSEAYKYGTASKELRNQIRQDTQDRIKEYEKELLAVQELFNAYKEQGFFGKFADNFGSSVRKRFGLGEGDGLRDIVGRGAALEQSIKRLRELQDEYQDLDTGRAAETEESAAAKTLKERNARLEKYRELLTGLDSTTLKYIDTEKELNEMFKNGEISVNELFTALDNLDKQYDENAETVDEWSSELSQFAKRAAENMQDAFADFLFDPFEEGTDGMLKSFSETLRRMAAEAASKNLLEGLFGFEDSKGGSQPGILSGIGDFFAGMFAGGGVIPAGQFGIVGENGPEIAYGGNNPATIIPMTSGGGGVSVNIINNAGADVSTRPGTNGASLDVIIDQAVAKNISMSGSQTNQALSNFNNRSITRR